MKTLVLQSQRTENCPSWIEQCLESVQGWCHQHNYSWHFLGDEIFDLVPGWYMDKTGKGPIAADYARLVAMKNLLAEKGTDQVIWLDADVYVLDDKMVLSSEKSCAFGFEVWIQQEGKTLRARKNVHNAVCLFKPGCVVLPFLIETVASIIQRANPASIAPQMVGPKLLSALHSLHDFALLPQVGALSLEVAADVINGGGPALDLLLNKNGEKLQAMNLCSSLLNEADAARVIDGISLLGR